MMGDVVAQRSRPSGRWVHPGEGPIIAQAVHQVVQSGGGDLEARRVQEPMPEQSVGGEAHGLFLSSRAIRWCDQGREGAGVVPIRTAEQPRLRVRHVSGPGIIHGGVHME